MMSLLEARYCSLLRCDVASIIYVCKSRKNWSIFGVLVQQFPILFSKVSFFAYLSILTHSVKFSIKYSILGPLCIYILKCYFTFWARHFTTPALLLNVMKPQFGAGRLDAGLVVRISTSKMESNSENIARSCPIVASRGILPTNTWLRSRKLHSCSSFLFSIKK